MLKSLTVAILVVAVSAVTVRGEFQSFRIGKPEPASGKAKSAQDGKADGSKDLTCLPGQYAFGLGAMGAKWGTDNAIEAAVMWCRTPGVDGANAFTFGKLPEQEPAFAEDRCTDKYGIPAIQGLVVTDERFIKDMRLVCGGIYAETGKVVASTVASKWMLDRHDGSDDNTRLSCGSDKVMNGLRIGFRKDKDETAFTSIQLLCGTVSTR